MNTTEINPYIRRAIHSVLIAPFRLSRRVIFDYELIYLENGNFLLNYGQKTYHCRPGDIILIHPGIPHSFEITDVNISQPHIHFDLQYDYLSPYVFVNFKNYPDLSEPQREMIRKDDLSNGSESPIIFVDDINTFLSIFKSTIDSFNGKQTLECKVKMMQLLDIIIKNNFSEALYDDAAPDNFCQNIKNYIDENYKNAITLSNLESQFNYSRFCIEKQFKRHFGISVIQYCNNLRMDFSRNQLCNFSVSEVCRQVGYASIYSFSRAYRNHFGCSPTNYKKQLYKYDFETAKQPP